MTPDWTLLRGDDLVPPARIDLVDGTELVSRIQFELPKGWSTVETGWSRVGRTASASTTPSASSTVPPAGSSPASWAAAAELGNTDVTVAAPMGEACAAWTSSPC